jgi:hypothetical protein
MNQDFKALTCCDGSRLKTKGIRYVEHYAECISQCGMRIFFAICMIKNYVVLGADAINAYAQSPPPKTPSYVRLDAQYIKWFLWRFGVKLDRDLLLPVIHALQGHPYSGSIWAEMIVAILEAMGFKKTCHEPFLYAGTFHGHDIYACRQVDDMLFAGELESVLRELCTLLSTKVKIEVETNFVSSFNGLEIEQTRDYIKIHVSKYIDKILVGHGWEKSSNVAAKPMEPLHPNAYKDLETAEPPASPAEATAREKAAGFSYRPAVGELLFAYVTCHLDICFVMAELSKFNAAPGACHYAAAKRVFCYLRESKTDGIGFWRRESHASLPPVPLPKRPLDATDLLVPYPEEMDQLVGYMDAAHVTICRR